MLPGRNLTVKLVHLAATLSQAGRATGEMHSANNRDGKELTSLLIDEHVLLVLLGRNLAVQLLHVLGQLRLLLQLPLAAALRAQAVCFHALVLHVWAAPIVAVVVQLHSR